MTLYHIAQINVGRFRRPIDDPANEAFVSNLDPVNAVAEQAPGFIWRLTGSGNDATDIKPFDDPDIAINMSVWTDIEALGAFVYRTHDHLAIMRQRKLWFDPIPVPSALWWIEAGTVPTVEEGVRRLGRLAIFGPTAAAFTFRKPFPSPAGDRPLPVLEECA